MKTTIKTELTNHIQDLINDGVLTAGNFEDWHFHAFNEDYYIIGYYNAEQWLKRHEISAFQSIELCQEYEEENFGEITSIYDNAEKVVNMLAYIYGEELLNEIGEELLNEISN